MLLLEKSSRWCGMDQNIAYTTARRNAGICILTLTGEHMQCIFDDARVQPLPAPSCVDGFRLIAPPLPRYSFQNIALDFVSARFQALRLLALCLLAASRAVDLNALRRRGVPLN